MMKLKLILAFCTIATLFLHSQTTVFTKGTDVIEQGLYNRFIETADSGFMHTTLVLDSFLNRPFVHMIKYDRNGTIQWSKRIDAGEYLSQVNISCPVIQTHDGGYAIAITYSLWVPLRSYASIIRTDATGNVLWTNWYPGLSLSWANGICETVNHDLVVCGRTNDTTGIVRRGFVFRTDSAGNQLWAWAYDSPSSSYEEFFTIRESFTGDFLLYGTYQKRGIFHRITAGGAPLVAVFSNGVDRFTDGLETPTGNVIMIGPHYAQNSTSVYEITPVGTTTWSNKYQYGFNFKGVSITGAPGGYTMISLPSIGVPARAAHIDYNGNTLWSRQYLDLNGQVDPCIVHTSDNGYCFAGEYNVNSAQDFSIIVIKTDSVGMAECNSLVTFDAVTLPDTLVPDSFFVVGVMGSINVNHPSAGVLPHLVVHCQSSIGYDEYSVTDDVQVYPNPADSYITLETSFMQEEQIRIRLCDVTGRTVFEDELRANQQQVDLSAFSPGMYFLLVEHNGVLVAQKPIIHN